MLSLVIVNRDDAFIPTFLPSSAQRRQSSRGTAAAEQPAIKTMPAYDPDAEVAGLTLTIPSWMSSIDRTKSMAHLEAISPVARQNLLAALTELEGKIQEMLSAIEGES